MIANVFRRVFLPCLLALLASTAQAQCNNNPIAVNDIAEAAAAPILLNVLANDSEPNGEALTLSVTGTTCQATHEVVLDLIRLTPNPSIDSNCTLNYRIVDESGRAATATVTISSIADIFADGFENGTTNQWSATCAGSGC